MLAPVRKTRQHKLIVVKNDYVDVGCNNRSAFRGKFAYGAIMIASYASLVFLQLRYVFDDTYERKQTSPEN